MSTEPHPYSAQSEFELPDWELELLADEYVGEQSNDTPSAYMISDAKDPARLQYGRRGKAMQNHGTRGNSFPRSEYSDKRLAMKPEIDDVTAIRESEESYVEPQDFDNGVSYLNDFLENEDGPVEKGISWPVPGPWYKGREQDERRKRMVATAALADVLLQKLEVGEIDKTIAYNRFMGSLASDERARVMHIADAVIANRLEPRNQDSDADLLETLISEELLGHYRDSRRLQSATTLDERPVADIDYLDGFSVRSQEDL